MNDMRRLLETPIPAQVEASPTVLRRPRGAMSAEDFNASVGARLAEKRNLQLRGATLAPMEPPAAPPTNAMGQAFEAAKSQRGWAPAPPAPSIKAPDLGFAEGPLRNNSISFTAPEIAPLNANTSLGAAPNPAAAPRVSDIAARLQGNSMQGANNALLRGAQDRVVAQDAVRAAEAATRAANPSSMTRAQLFSQPPSGITDSGSPMKLRPVSPRGSILSDASAAGLSRPPGWTPPAPAAPPQTGLRGMIGNTTGAVGNAARGTTDFAKANLGALGVMAGAAPGQLNVGKVLNGSIDGRATPIDVATQQAHESARLASQAAGGTLGGYLGAGMGIPTGPGALATGVAGTALGSWAGGKAYDMFKGTADGLLGNDPRTPLERMNAPASAAPAYDPANQTQATRDRTGLRLDNPGRGAGYDDPRRLDKDPSRASLGASRDFTNELNKVPAALPADLREGVVHKTIGANGRVTYSGRNVGQRADGSTQMVNGRGEEIAMRGSLDVAGGPVAMGAGGFATTPVSSDPRVAEQQRAELRAQTAKTLTNPDGSQWSQADNNRMAENLRDGADPYRNTSRAPKGEEGGAGTQQLRQLAAMPPGTPGRKGAIKSLIAMDQNQTVKRGQDISMDVALAPARLAAANRDTIMQVMRHPSIGNDPARGAAYLTSMGRPDLAEGLQKQADATLKMSGESDALVSNKWKDMESQFKGQYMNPDKNGTPEANSGLEARAFARLKRTNPTAFNLDPTARSAAVRNAIADEELMGAFGNPQGTGYANFVPEFLSSNRLDDRTREIPGSGKLRGTTISDRVGGLRGALSPDLEGGDYMLRTPGGRQTMNLGKLSADAKARLQQHIDQSNATK